MVCPAAWAERSSRALADEAWVRPLGLRFKPLSGLVAAIAATAAGSNRLRSCTVGALGCVIRLEFPWLAESPGDVIVRPAVLRRGKDLFRRSHLDELAQVHERGDVRD